MNEWIPAKLVSRQGYIFYTNSSWGEQIEKGKKSSAGNQGKISIFYPRFTNQDLIWEI